MNPLDSFGRHALATAEFLIVMAAATAFASGASRWGGALLIGAGGLALIQARVARPAGRVSSFGALYEALLDRAGEAVLCGGIALFFLRGGIAPERVTLAVMIAITALALALLAAYARARAEGLGVEARAGIPPVGAQVVLLGVVPLVLGPALLIWMMLAFAVASAVTLLYRAIHVARIGVRGAGTTGRKRDTLPGRGALRKGN